MHQDSPQSLGCPTSAQCTGPSPDTTWGSPTTSVPFSSIIYRPRGVQGLPRSCKKILPPVCVLCTEQCLREDSPCLRTPPSRPVLAGLHVARPPGQPELSSGSAPSRLQVPNADLRFILVVSCSECLRGPHCCPPEPRSKASAGYAGPYSLPPQAVPALFPLVINAHLAL